MKTISFFCGLSILLSTTFVEANHGYSKLYIGSEYYEHTSTNEQHIQNLLSGQYSNIENPDCVRNFANSTEFITKLAAHGKVTKAYVFHYPDFKSNHAAVRFNFGGDSSVPYSDIAIVYCKLK